MLVVDGVDISDDREKANTLNKAFAAKFTEGEVTVFPDCPSYVLPPLTHIECDADLVKTVLKKYSCEYGLWSGRNQCPYCTRMQQRTVCPISKDLCTVAESGYISGTLEKG